MLSCHSHLTFTDLYEWRTYFQVLETQLKQKVIVLKLSGTNSAVHCSWFSRLVKNDSKD